MGIFSNSSPFDEDVEKATSANATSEDWGLIMEICDRCAAAGPSGARDCLRAVTRRLAHNDPHVALHAATLLDACVANCGRAFLLEVASRDFDVEFRRVVSRAQPPVAKRLRALLRKWAEGEFRDDAQLALIPALYARLRAEDPDSSGATPAAPSTNPTATTTNTNTTTITSASAAARERDELARAIELSLREASISAAAAAAAASQGGAVTQLYPQVEAPSPPPRQVRALYDFEAAEDNELTFMAGEIVHVTDASDPNWWKGYNQRGEGLFPANFVSADLSEPAAAVADTGGRGGAPAAESHGAGEEEAEGALDAELLERALALLGEAPADAPGPSEPELLALERRAGAMAAGVDAALQRADRAHATLSRLGAELVDALNLYHELMRAPPPTMPPPSMPPASMPPASMPPQHYYMPPHHTQHALPPR